MCTRTTSLPAVQHKQFTTKDLLELEAQRQDQEDARKQQPVKSWRDSRRRKGQGEFPYLRRHYGILRHRIWTDNGAWRLQQPFRMRPSATASTMMRKKRVTTRHHWIQQGTRTYAINVRHERHCSLLMTLQLYHLPPPLPPPVSNSSVHTMPAPAFQQYCTVLLY